MRANHVKRKFTYACVGKFKLVLAAISPGFLNRPIHQINDLHRLLKRSDSRDR